MYRYCILDYTEYSIADCDNLDPTALVIADDCLSEFNNGYTNFKSRCEHEDAFKNDCTLCCTSGVNQIII